MKYPFMILGLATAIAPRIQMPRSTKTEALFMYPKKIFHFTDESRCSLASLGKTSMSPASMSFTIEVSASTGGSSDSLMMFSMDFVSSMRSKIWVSTSERSFFCTMASVSGIMVTGQ